jgi:hypothetical protein
MLSFGGRCEQVVESARPTNDPMPVCLTRMSLLDLRDGTCQASACLFLMFVAEAKAHGGHARSKKNWLRMVESGLQHSFYGEDRLDR